MAQQQKPKSKGFLASLASGLNTLVNEVEKGVTKATEEVNKAWTEATDQRFRKAFQLPPDERLYGEYWAQCLSGTSKTHSCSCYVSSNYFSFVVDLPGDKAKVMIPLKDIVNIQRAVTISSTGPTPVIQTAADPYVRADAIQIYTRDLKLHQFFSFLHYDKAYHSLMHAWKSAQGQPQPHTSGQTQSPQLSQATQASPLQPQQPVQPSTPQQPAAPLDKSASTPTASLYPQPQPYPYPSYQYPYQYQYQYPPMPTPAPTATTATTTTTTPPNAYPTSTQSVPTYTQSQFTQPTTYMYPPPESPQVNSSILTTTTTSTTSTPSDTTNLI
jgi:hypothetical protein